MLSTFRALVASYLPPTKGLAWKQQQAVLFGPDVEGNLAKHAAELTRSVVLVPELGELVLQDLLVVVSDSSVEKIPLFALRFNHAHSLATKRTGWLDT